MQYLVYLRICNFTLKLLEIHLKLLNERETYLDLYCWDISDNCAENTRVNSKKLVEQDRSNNNQGGGQQPGER